MKPRKIESLPAPTESVEQQCLFRWAAYESGAFPELGLLYHIPNEGKRTRAAGGRLKAEGLKTGVPDVCLPVARGGRNGLYIELKRQDGGKLTPDQADWLEALSRQGYHAVMCRGWVKAAQVIMDYLKGTRERGWQE